MKGLIIHDVLILSVWWYVVISNYILFLSSQCVICRGTRRRHKSNPKSFWYLFNEGRCGIRIDPIRRVIHLWYLSKFHTYWGCLINYNTDPAIQFCHTIRGHPNFFIFCVSVCYGHSTANSQHWLVKCRWFFKSWSPASYRSRIYSSSRIPPKTLPCVSKHCALSSSVRLLFFSNNTGRKSEQV